MTQNGQKGAQTAPATTQSKAIAAMKDELANGVLRRIEELQANGGLVIPKDYAVTNQMNLAWLRITEMTVEVDGKQRPVLEVVTKASVANSLLDMVLQGMDIQKKQGYFIVITNKAQQQKELTFWRSYFGDEKLARGQGMTKCRSIIVYEGDEFEYVYTEDGETRITKHVPNLTRVNKDKIVAAYAVVTMADGTRSVTLKTMQQIRQAWQQGATKGNSPAHRNFTDDMAARTVERAALKHLINSSSDAWLLSEEEKERRMIDTGAATPAGANVEEVKFEEVAAPAIAARSETPDETIPPAPAPTPVPREEAPTAQPKAMEEDAFKL